RTLSRQGEAVHGRRVRRRALPRSAAGAVSRPPQTAQGAGMMTLLDWLWHWLPDRCDLRGYGCARQGVRGNENLHDAGIGTLVRLCDYCWVKIVRPHRITP